MKKKAEIKKYDANILENIGRIYRGVIYGAIYY